MKKLLLLIPLLVLSGCDNSTITYQTETGYRFDDSYAQTYDCQMGHTYINFGSDSGGWQPMQNDEGAPMKCWKVSGAPQP